METLDPHTIEGLFPERRALWGDREESAEQRLLQAEESPEDPPPMGWAAMEPLLKKLPPREQDFVRLYYHQGLKQAQIASLFDLTQAAVSYRLFRARRRLEFLRVLPDLDMEAFRRDLAFLPRRVLDVVEGCYLTTCQSLVAARLGITQGAARSRYQAGMRLVSRRLARDVEDAEYLAVREGRDPEEAVREARASHFLTPYLRALILVSEHWNVLHEIEFPWQNNPAVIIAVDDE
jgi:DNA-directed RNA polymerase specialized sigma24 family protein